MDFPRLKALNKYWDTVPPTHVSVSRIAAFLGVRVEKSADAGSGGTEAVSLQQETSDILDMLTGAQPATEPHG